MHRSEIAYTELTVNSACDELFPGVEDVDAQATMQLRAALDAFDEGVFEYQSRVAAQAAGGSQADAGNKAQGSRGQRKTRREQIYASRIPEDRQFFRPVEVQSAEWAAFKPHLWLRGRQIHPAEPTQFSHPHGHMHSSPPAAPAAAGSGSLASSSSFAAAAGTLSKAGGQARAAAAGLHPRELVAHGSKLSLSPPVAPVLDAGVAHEEVLALDGTYEETFMIHNDDWETHVPPHLRRRRGRPRDEKAVAIGLPPIEPKNAVLYDIAETLLPELWLRLAPLLTPILNRVAAERQKKPGSGGRALSAFRSAGGGRLGGGEFEIITFSSGDEEAISGDVLVGGSDLALGLGRSPGIDDEDVDDDLRWPNNSSTGGYGGYGHDRFAAAADVAPDGGGGSKTCGPASFYSDGGDSILDCDSYDSEGEMYQLGGGGGRGSPLAGAKLVSYGPSAVPAVLPRDLLPPDSAFAAPPLARGPLLQRPTVPPVVPPPLVGAPSFSPLASPSQSHPQSRSPSVSQGPLRFSYSGEAGTAGTAAAPPPALAPLAPPLAPLQVAPNSLTSPQAQKAPTTFPPSQGSPGAQQSGLSSSPLHIVAQQLLGAGLAAPSHPQAHPHQHPQPNLQVHPLMQSHPASSVAVATAAAAMQPSSDVLTLVGHMPFRGTASVGIGASSGHSSMTIQHHHQHYQSAQQPQAQQGSAMAAHQPLPRRVPSLSLMSVPAPYNIPCASGATTCSQPAVTTVTHATSSGALEVSGTVIAGSSSSGGSGGVAGGGLARGPSFVSGGAFHCSGAVSGAGGKQPRLGGTGNTSFGSSAVAMTTPVAALAQHSRFLAMPGTGMAAGGVAQAVGGGGGAGGSPPRLRHSGISGGLAATVTPVAAAAGPAPGVGSCSAGVTSTNIPNPASAAATASGGSSSGGAGNGGHTPRGRLSNTTAAAATGSGHHSVLLAPLTTLATVGPASTTQLCRQPQQSSSLMQPVVLSRKMSGDLAATRGSLPFPSLSEGSSSGPVSHSISVTQQPSLQHQQTRRSNGSRTSPHRRNSQGYALQGAASAATPGSAAVTMPSASSSPSCAQAGSQQHLQQAGGGGVGSGATAIAVASPPAAAAAAIMGGSSPGMSVNVPGGMGAATRLPALSLSRTSIAIASSSSSANPSSGVAP